MIVEWIPGSENNADMFTKNLDGPLFKRYAEMLLGENALDEAKPKPEARGVSGDSTSDPGF